MSRNDRNRRRAPSWASRGPSRPGNCDSNSSEYARENCRRNSRRRPHDTFLGRYERRRSAPPTPSYQLSYGSTSPSAEYRPRSRLRSREDWHRRSRSLDFQARSMPRCNGSLQPRREGSLIWGPIRGPTNCGHGRSPHLPPPPSPPPPRSRQNPNTDRNRETRKRKERSSPGRQPAPKGARLYGVFDPSPCPVDAPPLPINRDEIYSRFGILQEEDTKVPQTCRDPPSSIPARIADILVPGSYSALANRIGEMSHQPSSINSNVLGQFEMNNRPSLQFTGNVPGQFEMENRPQLQINDIASTNNVLGQFQQPSAHQGHSQVIKREPEDYEDGDDSYNIQSPLLPASDFLDQSQFIKLEPPDEDLSQWPPTLSELLLLA
ncbi:hypothetical protein F5B21DRAFT_238095 [Xylaria acuta]|nr:hypothetical protein F5B21DRAFT_238095 [Xylaria acuta]